MNVRVVRVINRCKIMHVNAFLEESSYLYDLILRITLSSYVLVLIRFFRPAFWSETSEVQYLFFRSL